jgi:hypothetical protein
VSEWPRHVWVCIAIGYVAAGVSMYWLSPKKPNPYGVPYVQLIDDGTSCTGVAVDGSSETRQGTCTAMTKVTDESTPPVLTISKPDDKDPTYDSFGCLKGYVSCFKRGEAKAPERWDDRTLDSIAEKLSADANPEEAVSELALPLSDSDTAVRVNGLDGRRTPPFGLRLEREIVIVTASKNLPGGLTEATIIRHAYGTIAASHAAGTEIEMAAPDLVSLGGTNHTAFDCFNRDARNVPCMKRVYPKELK